jgi:hypothetical protein
MNDDRYSVDRSEKASLSAERVHGKARKIIHRPEQYERGVSYQTGRLETNAWCGEVIPLALVGKPGVRIISRQYRAIAGEKISYTAKKFSSAGLTTGSSTHKIQECILAGNVLCIVLRPILGLHTRQTP